LVREARNGKLYLNHTRRVIDIDLPGIPFDAGRTSPPLFLDIRQSIILSESY
jgi:hypothetical protein